jgi:hypothetical protein
MQAVGAGTRKKMTDSYIKFRVRSPAFNQMNRIFDYENTGFCI